MIYLFEAYELDTDRRELRREGNLLAVEPKVFDLLVHLVANRERVVSKDDLITAVWDGRIVSESTLASCINAARSAIGDNGEEQRLIKTLPRKGMRFVGTVLKDKPRTDADLPHGAVETPRPLLALPDKPSIAVLPFADMTGDPEHAHFSDGITEDIITALSRLRWFFVIARNSTFVYKGQAADVRQVGRDLGVRYILEGSVRKSGQRVRITGQLVDALTGNHIWSDRYDRELTDIFALQDEITANVAAAIEPRLVAAEGVRAEVRPAQHLDAWDLVARALSHFWKLTAGESATAIGILRQAVADHPRYAPAHSMLASALLVSSYAGWTPPGYERELAAERAGQAVGLDDSDPWAHLALGLLAMTGRRTEEALRHIEAALALNPNFATAYGFAGFTLCLDGQSAEAIRKFEQAMRMSPRDPFNSFFLAGMASAHYMAGRYLEAIEWGRRHVQLRSGIHGLQRILCASLAQVGQLEEAKMLLARLRQANPDLSVGWIEQWVPYTPRPLAHMLEGMRKAGLT